jgi:hypothetical protein
LAITFGADKQVIHKIKSYFVMKSLLPFSDRFFAFVERLIPDNLKSDTYAYRKAKILTYAHFSLILLGSFIWILQIFVLTDDPVPIWLCIIWGFLTIFLFKKTGNLIIAGNLIAASLAIPVAVFVPATGGLHSDNLLWLIVAPLVALLFGNRKSGLIWLLLLLFFTTYLWQFDAQFQDKQLSQETENADYYFISYFFLFAAIFVIVMKPF